jgi:hypothetical protein
MGAISLPIVDTFETIECCNCGLRFAVPRSWERSRRDDHKSFYCPNGHPQSFVGKSEAEIARDELAKEKQRREWAEAEAKRLREKNETAARSNAALRGHINHVKRRVGNGVCPCCNRTFSQLGRHMQAKHPGYQFPEIDAEGGAS